MQRRLLLATLLLCACKRDPSKVKTEQRAKASGPILYVTNEDSGDVTVIDGATNTVVGRIAVGKRPRGLRVHNERCSSHSAALRRPARALTTPAVAHAVWRSLPMARVPS